MPDFRADMSESLQARNQARPPISRFAMGGEFEIRRANLGNLSGLDKLTNGLQGTWSANGRTALARVLAKLAENGINHVHLPAYICDSVILAVKSTNLDFSFYPVDCNLVAHPDPPENSAVLLVHYFGRINPAAPGLRRESGKSFFLIEDACQALLSDWLSPQSKNIYYINSPRKFAEAPLGGWSNVQSTSVEQDEISELAWKSCAARQTKALYLAGLNQPIEKGIEDFYLQTLNAVERGFDEISLTAGLPEWVAAMIAGIDWSHVARQRLENHKQLTSEISGLLESPTNEFVKGEVPLGHLVLLEDRDRLRQKLMQVRIFCPVHWPLPNEVSKDRFPEAYKLSDQSLTLPIDQRYSAEHIGMFSDTLKACL
jgi:hypothetical protein